MKRRYGYLILAACILLNGCGELSIKRGASAGDLSTDRDTCKKAGSDQAHYEKCMSDHGWTVKRLDDLDPVATIIPSLNNRVSDAESKTPALGKQVTTEASPQQTLMDVFTIGSWWKAGGKPEGLKLAVNACADKLGEVHRPAAGSHQATRGLLLCLKEQGWHGLQEK